MKKTTSKVAFLCPSCSNPSSAPRAYRGQAITCLSCEQSVTVPLNAPAAPEPKKKIGIVKMILAIMGAIILIQLLWGFVNGIFAGLLS